MDFVCFRARIVNWSVQLFHSMTNLQFLCFLKKHKQIKNIDIYPSYLSRDTTRFYCQIGSFFMPMLWSAKTKPLHIIQNQSYLSFFFPLLILICLIWFHFHNWITETKWFNPRQILNKHKKKLPGHKWEKANCWENPLRTNKNVNAFNLVLKCYVVQIINS